MKLRFPGVLAWMPMLLVVSVPLGAATYYVDGPNPKAGDANPGTRAAPWKTIGRAGHAPELKPGDEVVVLSGIYREHVDITVSGEPGHPITFAAAPGHRVVVKGSEIVRGPWTRLSPADVPREPFPFAFKRVWKTRLSDDLFRDTRFPHAYDDKAKRWVSQVFWGDEHALQRIGPDPVYPPDRMTRMVNIGQGLADLIPQSFWFDSRDQTLYLNINGDPTWTAIEVGVRGFVLSIQQAHDVVVRGLELRHNRQPGQSWPLASLGACQRVTVEDCRITLGDYSGLHLQGVKGCVVRRCLLAHNGAVGLTMSLTEDCVVEDCALMFNNYRQFYGDWGVSAGMKCIPGNKRTLVQRCEVAYNQEAEGIWFDTDNQDIRILDNVCHDNGDCGIFFEFNEGGGVIAGNLVFGNQGRGIFVSGSQNTWVVHNTIIENASGLVAMTRAKGQFPRNTRVLNNLLVRNYIATETITRGADLTLEASTNAAVRAELGLVSDYNTFATNTWTPVLRHNWNDGNSLPGWQARFDLDLHSRLMTIPYERSGTGFRLLLPARLDGGSALPEAVTRVWQPLNPGRVGANLSQWPKP
jgi:parallel beta-helix repeat protein